MGSKLVDNSVLDAALNIIKNGCTEIYVCSGGTSPATRAAAITAALASKTSGIASGDFTVADGDTSGRKLTTTQYTGVSVGATGSAENICLCSGTTLLYTTTCNAQSLTSGNTLTIPAWKIEIADPS